MSSTTNALKILLEDAVGPICSNPNLVIANKTKLFKCFKVIESGLGYQYHNVWHQVLYVINKMFEVNIFTLKWLPVVFNRNLTENC